MKNSVHAHLTTLKSEFGVSRQQAGGDTLAVACLRQLLKAMRWTGSEEQLFEVMPYFGTIYNIDGIREALARLDYDTKPTRKPMQLRAITSEQLPCMFVPKDGNDDNIQVLLDINSDMSIRAYDGKQAKTIGIVPKLQRGTVYFVEEVNQKRETDEIGKSGWLRYVLKRFRYMFATIFAVSFASNIFALAIPLFVMGVYDKAIGTRSLDILVVFSTGVVLVIATDWVLRVMRARAQAFIGARLDTIIATASLQQLLSVPVTVIENAPLGSQVTKLKQMEKVGEAFVGSLVTAIFDLPFIVFFLLAAAIIAGNMVLVPVSLLIIYAVLASIIIPVVKRHISNSSETIIKKKRFLMESLENQRAIGDMGEEENWIEQYRRISARCTDDARISNFFNLSVQVLSQALVTVSGIAALGIGAMMVLDGTLTPGTLIAAMLLIWRVLSPLQQSFLSLNRLGQMLQSLQQIDRLMKISTERQMAAVSPIQHHFHGNLVVRQLSFRHNKRRDLTLHGVEFEISEGEIVAISGPSGAGKTTLLNIITEIYKPQAGAVLMDGTDIRQLEYGEWRRSIGYAPKVPHIFYGTIRQNLLLARPSANEDDIEQAAREAGLDGYRDKLPKWLETRITRRFLALAPDGLKQRINLARAYIKDVPLYLFDNPGQYLDGKGDQEFMTKITSLKGRATVIIATQRLQYIRCADRLLYMKEGRILHDGKPDDVLLQLQKAA
jgi:ATP-binding cassette subfamily C protein/ATP-binding cassette subfamily C protein LapB